MKYVINPQYRLRGWYKAPTGLYDTRRKEARFCLKEQYLLLLHCNGVDDIDESTLSEDNAKFLEKLKEDHVIREAGFLDYLQPENGQQQDSSSESVRQQDRDTQRRRSLQEYELQLD